MRVCLTFVFDLSLNKENLTFTITIQIKINSKIKFSQNLQQCSIPLGTWLISWFGLFESQFHNKIRINIAFAGKGKDTKEMSHYASR